MKKIISTIIVSMVIVLTSCNQTKYVYVVQRDTPVKPVFTVIGIYRTSSDIKLASDTELALIKLGISVIRPPINKSITKQSGGIDASASQGTDGTKNSTSKGKVNTGEITEEYNVLADTKADYVIFVNSAHRTFKIVKKDNLEILVVENSDMFSTNYGLLANTDNESAILNEYKIYDIFTALGLKVKQPKDSRPAVKVIKESQPDDL